MEFSFMGYMIIDVRESEEFANTHVENAINIPLGNIDGSNVLNNLPKDTEIIVYCNSGNRSGVALDILNKLGYRHVTDGVNQKQTEIRFGL